MLLQLHANGQTQQGWFQYGGIGVGKSLILHV